MTYTDRGRHTHAHTHTNTLSLILYLDGVVDQVGDGVGDLGEVGLAAVRQRAVVRLVRDALRHHLSRVGGGGWVEWGEWV